MYVVLIDVAHTARNKDVGFAVPPFDDSFPELIYRQLGDGDDAVAKYLSIEYFPAALTKLLGCEPFAPLMMRRSAVQSIA